MKSWRAAQKRKKFAPSQHEFYSIFICVRGHDRSLPHLHNQAQTSNKAHDKFVPRRDCALADRSRPFLSTALLSGWSSHLVIIGFRLTPPLSQAHLLGQDELTRRKHDLDTLGHERSLPHFHNQASARIPPITSKDSLDEASSPSVAQSLRTGS